MNEFLKCISATRVCCAVFVIAGLITSSAHAQFTRPERVDLNVTATFVHPTEVESGEMFPVYAWINNHSDQAILAPFPQSVIVRTHLGTYYVSDTCRIHCIFARSQVIAPGAKVLMHMGDVDTTAHPRNPGEFSFSDVLMGGYTPDQKIYIFDVEDTVPVTIEPMPFTGYPSVPQRQALELADEGKLVRDPNTGYEWLRFNHSAGLTEATLQARLSADGDLYGFAIASRHQVQQLVLNHVQSLGIAARPVDLSGMFFNARTAFTQLVELMQATEENENKIFINGVVQDAVPLMDGKRQFARVHLYGEKNPDTLFFSSPLGMEVSVADETSLSAANATTGVWLLRGAVMNRHLSLGKAAYADDYLFLPNVLIDGANYRMEMYRKEGTTPSFVAVDIRGASTGDLMQPVAAFDAATGLLDVKNVTVMSDLPVGEYDLTLKLFQGTELPLATLVNASMSAVQR